MISLVLVAAWMASTPAATDFVGLWESTTTSAGGIGHAVELRSDGTLIEVTIVIVDGYYRVVGDRLVIDQAPLGADAELSKAARIRIEGDLLVQTAADGSEVRKERLGSAEEGKPPIVGVWRYPHYAGGIAYERYSEDGRMSFRLPMIGAAGTLEPKGKELILTLPSHSKSKIKAKVNGDQLSIKKRGGNTTDYRRVQAGAWYELKPTTERP